MSKNQIYKNKFQNYFLQVVLKTWVFLCFSVKLKQLMNYYFIYKVVKQMAQQRIRDCLEMMEGLCMTDYTENDSVGERIRRVAFEVNTQHEYRVNLWLLEEQPCDLTYQQVLYQLIPWLTISETQKDELEKLLLGENNEYIMEGDWLYTSELYNNIYEIIVKEHLDSWRSFLFDEADLEGEELERHSEYVAYAKEHGL